MTPAGTLVADMVDDRISLDASDGSDGSDGAMEWEFVDDDDATVALETDTTEWFAAYETVLSGLWAEEATSRGGLIGIVLVGTQRIQALNREYLGKDRPTDVLSFDLSGDADRFEGEVYIGVDRAAAQAEEIGCSIAEEIARLMIHGVLHLAGHDHGAADDECPMLAATERWLERWRAASREPA